MKASNDRGPTNQHTDLKTIKHLTVVTGSTTNTAIVLTNISCFCATIKFTTKEVNETLESKSINNFAPLHARNN